jgi:hypothetical protein
MAVPVDPIDPRTLEALTDVDASNQKIDDPNLTTLSSGVVLRHKRVPPMVLAKIDEKYVDPPIPTFYESTSDKYFPNPDDPNYIEAKEKVVTDKGNALVDVLIALGTAIEYLPESMQSPEDQEWVDELGLFGIEVPKLKTGRYLSWVKYYAAQSVSDFENMAKRGAKHLGVTEEAVATAIASFQDNETRQSDSESQVKV